MKKINLILGIIVIVILSLSFVKLKTSGNVVDDQNSGMMNSQDVFEGVITNMELSPQILDGTGVYDRSCNPVENDLTQCDAGIQTSAGLLNFNYKHNMHMQACIDAGQNLKVEILEENKARVTRY